MNKIMLSDLYFALHDRLSLDLDLALHDVDPDPILIRIRSKCPDPQSCSAEIRTVPMIDTSDHGTNIR